MSKGRIITTTTTTTTTIIIIIIMQGWKLALAHSSVKTTRASTNPSLFVAFVLSKLSFHP